MVRNMIILLALLGVIKVCEGQSLISIYNFSLEYIFNSRPNITKKYIVEGNISTSFLDADYKPTYIEFDSNLEKYNVLNYDENEQLVSIEVYTNKNKQFRMNIFDEGNFIFMTLTFPHNNAWSQETPYGAFFYEKSVNNLFYICGFFDSPLVKDSCNNYNYKNVIHAIMRLDKDFDTKEIHRFSNDQIFYRSTITKTTEYIKEDICFPGIPNPLNKDTYEMSVYDLLKMGNKFYSSFRATTLYKKQPFLWLCYPECNGISPVFNE
ncbi:MAG: hypothetical protein MK212_04130 [Saprospiraceae bacterium]|nr:hypothetical protein [Saprospiraceae bacterium]